MRTCTSINPLSLPNSVSVTDDGPTAVKGVAVAVGVGVGVALPWASVWDWSDCPEDIAQNATREVRTAMAMSHRNVSTRRGGGGGGGGRFFGIHLLLRGWVRGLKRGISRVW